MQSHCINLGLFLHLNHIKLPGAFSCIEHACHYTYSRFLALQPSYVARRASGLSTFLAAAPGQKRANETLASYIFIILAPIKIPFQRPMTCTNHARLIALKNMTRQLKAFPSKSHPPYQIRKAKTATNPKAEGHILSFPRRSPLKLGWLAEACRSEKQATDDI